MCSNWSLLYIIPGGGLKLSYPPMLQVQNFGEEHMAINRTQLLLQELKHKLYLQWRLSVPAETYQIPSPLAGRAYPSRSSVVWTAEILGDTLAIQQSPDMTVAYIYNQSHVRNDRLIEVIFCFERYCCTKQWGTFARNRI